MESKEESIKVETEIMDIKMKFEVRTTEKIIYRVEHLRRNMKKLLKN
jgi:hypothetical protein